MDIRRIGALGLVLAWFVAASAARADGIIYPHCFSQSQDYTGFSGNWALMTDDEASGAGTPSGGWQFDDDTERAMACSFIVPDDYDQGGSDPSLTIMGWVTGGTPCTGLGCNIDYVIRFDADWENSVDGTQSAGWSTPATSDTYHYTSTSCGGGNCYPGGVTNEFSMTAAGAGDWDGGRLVTLRIRRITTGLGLLVANLPQPFHVVAIKLTYPN